jgi:hypothetical protein
MAVGYGVFVGLGVGDLTLPLAYACAGVVTFVAGAWMMARAGVRLDARRLLVAAVAYAGLALLVRATI